MKTYTLKEQINIITSNGYHLDRVSGSHKIYKNDSGRMLVLAISRSNNMIFRRLCKEHNLKIK